jgi:hypothetical protein
MSFDLVLWTEPDGDQPRRAVGLVNPTTGEIVRADNPADVARWYLAYREFQETVARPAADFALDLLNGYLDALTVSKVQVELDGGHVVEIAGESKGAADGAQAVESAEALRADLDVLVERGELAAQAADAAVTVSTVTTYKADLRKVKALAARSDVVGQTVRDHLVDAPRDRKRPTVKRLA